VTQATAVSTVTVKKKKKEAKRKRGMGYRNKEGTFSPDRLRTINVTSVNVSVSF